MFALYIFGIITIPLIGTLAMCELVFNIIERRVPAFRRWLDGLYKIADTWE